MSELPEGWEIVFLGEVITHQKGFAFKSDSYSSKGTRIVRISDTSRNSINDNAPVYFDDSIEELSNYVLHTGDVILSTVGSRPHLLDSMVGKAVKIPKKDDGSLLNQNLVKLTPKKDIISNDYLFSMLKKRKFNYYISTLVRGNANQVSITLAELFKYKIPLPPLPEQRKISQILSTWDKAIATTEKQIANSKQQKKALMQQLLTGKKRLAGFSGGWEVVVIGSMATLTAGGTPSTKCDEYWGGEIPWMNSGEINLKQVYAVEGRITALGLQSSSTKEIPINSVLIALAGQGKTRGTVAINKIKLCTNQSIAAIMPETEKLDSEFLYFNLDSRYQELRSMSTGDGGRGGLNLSILKSIKLKLPPLKEQQKIAQVLTTADNEISTLETQLTHLQQEKKALMQQLLTGKRRVLVD